MHLLSRDALKEAGRNHVDLEKPLDVWYRVAKKAEWKSLAGVRRTYPHVDAVGKYTVFNIKGNHYRLITVIKYQSRIVFVRGVMTHAEYERGAWKS